MNPSLPQITQVNLCLDDFIIENQANDDILLGKGSFAVVYRAYNKKLN